MAQGGTGHRLTPAQHLVSLNVLILHELSGRSRAVEDAVAALRQDGVNVTLATVRSPGPIHERARELGVASLALRCRSSSDYPVAIVRLARFIRRDSIDVIHAIEAIPATIGGLAGLTARRGGRLFHWQHSAAEGKQALFSRVGGRLAHLVMACSRFAGDYAIAEEGVPKERVRVAYNGAAPMRMVRAAEIAKLRSALRIPRDAAVVSVVARLRPEKGIATLVDALPRISHRMSRPVHVLVAGEGTQRRELEERARAVAPGTVHFVGHQNDVAPWFAVGDVVAVPSYREAFGFTAAEAMACRRPLVASDVGGLREIVDHRKTGLLVTPGDPEALADGIAELLITPDGAAAFGAAGYERYRRLFTVEAMVSGWMACYRELRGDSD